ncbi:MAG: hypothetical protein VKL39_01215 [Leptolyngbyaceae bacterium]|nr:hypothetical protein [Leptolyngbyaceae bacterium]
MADVETSWYIVQNDTGHCDILSSSEKSNDENQSAQQWGPFASEGEAIARRVGLIRAGKCKPVTD